MIFVRSTLREFTAVGIAVFLVLLVITFTTQLIRFLGFAAGGRHPHRRGARPARFLRARLPVGAAVGDLVLSVLLSVTRAYRDSEMVVWQSSGARAARLVRSGAPVRCCPSCSWSAC